MRIRLCDFYAVLSEKKDEQTGRLIVRGELHPHRWDEQPEIWVAEFEPQDVPKGSWVSCKMEREQD